MSPFHFLNKITALVLVATAQFAAGDDFSDTCTAVVKNYANIVRANYSDSLTEGKKLKSTIDAFLKAPSSDTLEAAKTQWIAARQPYLQTEVFRFYAGPIDDEDGPEPMLNGWPMDESYVDYVVGSEQTGIIGDVKNFPTITQELIASLNEQEGETLITCGFHAIEFLLWGQDLSETGPGARPFTDYTTRANADRRGAYLRACGGLLVSHLESIVAAWQPGEAANYRAAFLASDPKTTIRNILYGAKTLAGVEFSGERLLVAWDTQMQEDEHSCFSDTTHQDAFFNAKGIANVFAGRYAKLDGEMIEGPGLNVMARLLDAATAKKLSQNIDDMMTAAKAIPRPFDQAILGERESDERQKIMKCVEILEDQSALWARLERKLLAK